MSLDSSKPHQTVEEKIDELLEETGTPAIMKGKSVDEIHALFKQTGFEPADGEIGVVPTALVRTSDNKIVQVETGDGKYDLVVIMEDASHPVRDEIIALKTMAKKLQEEQKGKTDNIKSSETKIPKAEEKYVEGAILTTGRKFVQKITKLLTGKSEQ